jgi:Skp family chaperone for outer membrane proteins
VKYHADTSGSGFSRNRLRLWSRRRDRIHPASGIAWRAETLATKTAESQTAADGCDGAGRRTASDSIAPEKPKPIISEMPQPLAASPGENAEQPKRKTPEERKAMRAEWAKKRAKREERMRKKAQREQQQSV